MYARVQSLNKYVTPKDDMHQKKPWYGFCAGFFHPPTYIDLYNVMMKVTNNCMVVKHLVVNQLRNKLHERKDAWAATRNRTQGLRPIYSCGNSDH